MITIFVLAFYCVHLDEFTLDESSPNARIKIDNSNTIVIVNVDPPRIVEPGVSPYKVSLELMSMQLCDPTANDRLKIVHVIKKIQLFSKTFVRKIENTQFNLQSNKNTTLRVS